MLWRRAAREAERGLEDQLPPVYRSSPLPQYGATRLLVILVFCLDDRTNPLPKLDGGEHWCWRAADSRVIADHAVSEARHNWLRRLARATRTRNLAQTARLSRGSLDRSHLPWLAEVTWTAW